MKKGLIGILGAMDVETEGLARAMTDLKQHEIGGSVFYTGKLCGRDAALVRSGIGKVNAALAAAVLIFQFGAEEVLITGVAGSLGGLKTLQTLVPDQFVQHDVSLIGEQDGYIDILSSIKIYPDMAMAERLACVSGAKRGLLATGEQFIAHDGAEAVLRKFPEAVAVDMESAAVAHVCNRLKVPMACLKVISDGCDGGEYSDFVSCAAKKAIDAVLAYLGE